MEASKVYFVDFSAKRETLQQKLRRLILTAGIKNIDFDKKFTCIKLHLGEPGNLAYLRPNYAKTVADVVKELGGKPFLSDANTLYVGRRKNALEHLEAAYENGFSPFSTGCHVIIADGLKGTDEALVPVEGGEYVKEAKIGRAFMDADVFLSLTHFKGHESAGFGGCLKNIGMGCGSRAGKMEMHSNSKPLVKTDKCVGCRACGKDCAHGAISFGSGKAAIDEQKCVGCGRCIGACPMDAIQCRWDEAYEVLACKIAEYTKAVVDKRPCFHISLVCDVSPSCDCDSCNDLPIIPDVGMFASFDPVALDQACVDAVNQQSAARGSVLDEVLREQGLEDRKKEYFRTIHPDTRWEEGLVHAEKLGLGTRQYELIQL